MIAIDDSLSLFHMGLISSLSSLKLECLQMRKASFTLILSQFFFSTDDSAAFPINAVVFLNGMLCYTRSLNFSNFSSFQFLSHMSGRSHDKFGLCLRALPMKWDG